MKVSTSNGPVRAVTFVANRASDHYVGRVSFEEQIERIYHASGVLGSNADYLFRLVERLEELGIGDRPFERLRHGVAEKINVG